MIWAAAFAVAAALPWLGKAWHIDEPLYLPVARRILEQPLDPYGFLFNWYGRAVPYPEINNTPPLLHYLLAGALAVSGGSEWLTRLLFLPFDAAAAAALYLIARHYLKEPLWPTLLVLSCPAWLINMGHVMAEKPVMAFGLWAVVFALRGRWLPTALLLAAALMTKYLAVLFLPVALLLLPGRRLRTAALACAPLALYVLWQKAAAGAAVLVTAQSLELPTAGWAHKLRSVLAFIGGGVLVGAPNPAPLPLFLPWLDVAPVVRPLDRLLGAGLACAGAGALWGAARGRRIWLVWTAAALAVTLAYWSVMARLVLFLAPPLVFAFAERRKVRRLHVALALTLSFALQWVDMVHAGAQRAVVGSLAGRRLWSAGHWGLQEYVTRAGGGVLEDWSQAKPGDVVLVPRVNSSVLKPRSPVVADVRTVTVTSRVPLRLLSGWTGEGGFYSNVFGFLPFSLSTEPVDEIAVVELK